MEAQKPGRKECKKSDICRTVDNLRHKKLFRLLLKAGEIGSNGSIKIDKVSIYGVTKLPSSAYEVLGFSLSRQISNGMFLVFKDYSTLSHCKMIKEDHVFLNMSRSHQKLVLLKSVLVKPPT